MNHRVYSTRPYLISVLVAWFVLRVWVVGLRTDVIACKEALAFCWSHCCVPNKCCLVSFFSKYAAQSARNTWMELFDKLLAGKSKKVALLLKHWSLGLLLGKGFVLEVNLNEIFKNFSVDRFPLLENKLSILRDGHGCFL